METRSIKLNFIMNALLTMSSLIFPLISFPYVSRILLPEGVGKVSFAISLISYFSMIAQLGIPVYGIKECAKVRDDKIKLSKTVHELFFINTVTVVIAYILLFFLCMCSSKLIEDRVLYLIVSSTIILNLFGMEWLYKALEQYTYITMRSIIFKFIAMIAMFIFIHDRSDYIIYGAISVFASSASMILNMINVHKFIVLKKLENYNVKRHLKPIIIFFMLSCAASLYMNMDTVLLGYLTTDVNVGYYNTAIKVKSILVSVITSLGAVILPRASYYIEKGLDIEFNTITKKSARFIFVIAIPLTVYFVIFAKPVIYILAGTSFDGAVLPMQIVMCALLPIGLTNLIGIQILTPLGREKIILYANSCAAVTDIIVNFLLIPHLGASGAAIASLSAECVVLFIEYRYIKRNIKGFLCNISYIKICVATFAATICSIWVLFTSLNNFCIIIVSSCIYYSMVYAILYIMKESFIRETLTNIYGKINIIKKKGRSDCGE